MRNVIVMLFIFVMLVDAKEFFITKDEYAKMLYENPRGISCAKCHGQKGQGLVIATYKENGITKKLQTQPIYQLDYNTFKKGIKEAKGIMPKYYLTQKEIAALYYHLQSINRTKKEPQ